PQPPLGVLIRRPIRRFGMNGSGRGDGIASRSVSSLRRCAGGGAHGVGDCIITRAVSSVRRGGSICGGCGISSAGRAASRGARGGGGLSAAGAAASAGGGGVSGCAAGIGGGGGRSPTSLS